MQENQIVVYTIGHGRHAWTDFLALLQKYEIAFLCDVRSAARSRWVQFNGAVLSANFATAALATKMPARCRRSKRN